MRRRKDFDSDIIFWYSVFLLTNETLSFLTAEVYCSSLISDRLDDCEIKYGDLTAISLTPSYHSAGHKPLKKIILQNKSRSESISKKKNQLMVRTRIRSGEAHNNTVQPKVPEQLP